MSKGKYLVWIHQLTYHKLIVSLINRMVESSKSHWMPCLDCVVRKQQVAVCVVHWMQVLSFITSLKSTHSLTTTDQKRLLQKRCNFNYHAIKGNLHTVSRLTFSMQECSSFLTGDALRTRTRFKALDETGVMGTLCRHETPISFINLHHGERCCDGISMHHSRYTADYRLLLVSCTGLDMLSLCWKSYTSISQTTAYSLCMILPVPWRSI